MLNNLTFPNFLNLNLLDLGKGFIVSLLTSALTVLYQTIGDGGIPTGAQLKSAAIIGLGAGISYLIKNLLTGIPKTIEVDPNVTTVLHKDTKKVLVAGAKAKPGTE